MLKSLTKFEPQAYALMRIVSGFMFTFHGAQKVLGIHGGMLQPFGSRLWIAGIIELVGGLAITLGFNTRVFAFLASGEMAVAYVQGHWKMQTGWDFFPSVNHGELAALYSVVFFIIACKGGGIAAMTKD